MQPAELDTIKPALLSFTRPGPGRRDGAVHDAKRPSA